MLPETRVWTRDEMMKRVAFFKDLRGARTGLPDSHLPECDRELINVIGFQPPENEGEGGVVSPVGEDVALQSAIPITEGFNSATEHGGRLRPARQQHKRCPPTRLEVVQPDPGRNL